MTTSSNKKKFPVAFVLLAFFAIAVLMFVANSRSTLKVELAIPVGAVDKLYTADDSLVAVSNKTGVYVWDWKTLSDKPKVGTVNADNVLWLPTNRMLWTPANHKGTIVLSNFPEGVRLRDFALPAGFQCRYISGSGDGRFVALGLIEGSVNATSSDSLQRFRVARFSCDDRAIAYVTTLDLKEGDFEVHNVGMSNDGKLIAVVGHKGQKGWISVASVEQRKLIWERVLDNVAELARVVFSPDSHTIYTGGTGRYVYGLNATTGGTLCEWQIEETKVPNKEQYIPAITVSPGGKLVAATAEPADEIYIWKSDGKEVFRRIRTGHFINAQLAFSSEASVVAAVGSKSGKIKLFQIPD